MNANLTLKQTKNRKGTGFDDFPKSMNNLGTNTEAFLCMTFNVIILRGRLPKGIQIKCN